MIEVFDNSMLACYKLCPRKFYWRMVRHLVPKNELNHIPAFGGALHEALAAWYKTGDAGTSDKAFVTNWLPYEGQDKSGNRCMERGLVILEQYRQKYPLEREPFKVQNPDYIEIGLSFELGDYLYCGKADGCVQWTMGFVGLCLLEHKFSSKKGYLTPNPNDQVDGYILGVGEITGEPVIGCYFNQIYHGTTSYDKHSFERELTRRTPEELADWKESTIAWMTDVNTSLKRGQWPRNTNNCGAYFRACEYIPLCKLRGRSEQEVEQLVSVLFEENKWSPYPEARGAGNESND